MKVALIGKFHQVGIDILDKKQIQCDQIYDTSPENLIRHLIDVDAIGVRTAKLSRDILESCSKLKIVARHGVGYDSVDLNYLNEKKIPLAVTGTANAVAVAEHVMMMFLGLAKKSHFADHLVKQGGFAKKNLIQDTYELFQKNILIAGFGRIGKEVAKRCLSFDTKVFVFDPYVERSEIENNGCIVISFEEGIKIADFITLHMPLTDKTNNLIAYKELQTMKPNCILVNTARGGIVNQNDLAQALNSDIIFAAGLDVFIPEPPESTSPILNTKNLMLSPHNAALTLECRKRMSIETIENILSHLNGDTNKSNIINKEIL